MTELLTAIFILFGGIFAFIAALGVYRFPDFYTRMHAATKAGAFGASLLLMAAIIYFGSLRVFITSGLIITFFYLTAPVAAQTAGQAAYRRGVAFWSRFGRDELAEDEQRATKQNADT